MHENVHCMGTLRSGAWAWTWALSHLGKIHPSKDEEALRKLNKKNPLPVKGCIIGLTWELRSYK